MSFVRSVGASADVKELEYISALHQTCVPDTRANGTISSLDVKYYLCSRYGLKLSHAECVDILRGLSGGLSHEEIGLGSITSQRDKRLLHLFLSKRKEKSTGTDSVEQTSDIPGEETLNDLDIPEEYLDIVQIVSILLIPVLKRAKEDNRGDLDHGETNSEPRPTRKRKWLTGWLRKHSMGGHNDAVDLEVENRSAFEAEDQRNDDASFSEYRSWISGWKYMITPNYLQNRKRAELASLNPDSPQMIEDVLEILLVSLKETGDFSAQIGKPLLNASLVRNILVECGELERSRDAALVDELVEAASSPSGRLDAAAFAKCLTSDLDQWEVRSEDRVSTHFFDIFGEERSDVMTRHRKRRRNEPDEEESSSEKGVFDRENCRDHSNSDFVVDTHASVICIVIIWFFYFLVAVTYAAVFKTAAKISCKGIGLEGDFACVLVSQLWNWLIVAVFLCVFGVIVVLPLSVGNNPFIRTTRRYLWGIFLASGYAIVPYILVLWFAHNAEKPYTDAEQLVTSPFFEPILRLNLATGLVLASVYFFSWLIFLTPMIDSWLKTSNTRGEGRSKKAATRKLNRVLRNAYKLHSEPETGGCLLTVDQCMANYVLDGERNERTGGFFWTWHLLLSGALFDTEGIWLPSRFIIFQCAQVSSAFIATLIFRYLIKMAEDAAEEASQDLPENVPDWFLQLIPSKREVRFALYPALVVAIVAMVILILIYIPSMTSTVLRYRSGQIPSLGSVYFGKYRTNVDYAYMNMANAVYGLLGSASLLFIFFGLVLFLFVWEFSRNAMITLLAWGIGLSATTLLKMVLTHTCQARFFKSFYRTRPGHSNISTLAFETWYLGLGSGVLVGRITQFLFAAVFWIGRIDVPFLSEDVSLFGYAFDYVPVNFVKDILLHEAHRHPFLERLGVMYLMRFHHKERFGTRAGAVWRQIFVQTLLPWMRKNRVFSKARVEQAIEAMVINKSIARQEAMGLAERLGEDVKKNTEVIGQVGGGLVAPAGVAAETIGDLVETAADRVDDVGGITGGLIVTTGDTAEAVAKVTRRVSI